MSRKIAEFTKRFWLQWGGTPSLVKHQTFSVFFLMKASLRILVKKIWTTEILVCKQIFVKRMCVQKVFTATIFLVKKSGQGLPKQYNFIGLFKRQLLQSSVLASTPTSVEAKAEVSFILTLHQISSGATQISSGTTQISNGTTQKSSGANGKVLKLI